MSTARTTAVSPLRGRLTGPEVRARVRYLSARQGLDADAVVLAIGELIGNACRHGAPPVVVRVAVEHGALTIMVYDAGRRGLPDPAQVPTLAQLAEAVTEMVDSDAGDDIPVSGRGLGIVRECATELDWGFGVTGDRKFVRAKFLIVGELSWFPAEYVHVDGRDLRKVA